VSTVYLWVLRADRIVGHYTATEQAIDPGLPRRPERVTPSAKVAIPHYAPQPRYGTYEHVRNHQSDEHPIDPATSLTKRHEQRQDGKEEHKDS